MNKLFESINNLFESDILTLDDFLSHLDAYMVEQPIFFEPLGGYVVYDGEYRFVYYELLDTNTTYSRDAKRKHYRMLSYDGSTFVENRITAPMYNDYIRLGMVREYSREV